MRITTAGRQDIAAIKNLLSACRLHHSDVDGKSGQEFLLAWQQDDLVGTVGTETAGEFALLRSLAVAPTFRRQGVGSRLLNAAESRARSRQVRVLYLLTLSAADYFEARGYRRTSRAGAPAALQQTTEFESLCPATAVCMKKGLV